MSTIAADPTTDLRVDARRARFRDAVSGLSSRARSGDLLRMLLLPASACVLLGFGLMLLGWWGAANTHRQVEQIPYLISGGLVGLGLVVLGGLLLATAVWVSTVAGLRQRDEERHAAQLAELVAALQPPPPAPRNGTRSTKAATTARPKAKAKAKAKAGE